MCNKNSDNSKNITSRDIFKIYKTDENVMLWNCSSRLARNLSANSYPVFNTWRTTAGSLLATARWRWSPWSGLPVSIQSINQSLPARRYASAGISCHRVSVHLSVTRQYCVKTDKRRITQTTPRNRAGIL